MIAALREKQHMDTVIEELPEIDSELIIEIKHYLSEFSHDLLDGNVVRDALLDLMNIARRN